MILTNVQVPLQNLLDHTVTRLLDDSDIQLQIDRLVEKNSGQPILVEFIYKFGFDGTQGLMKVKQVTDDTHKPGALFASNLVALQLVTYVNRRFYILYDNACCNSSKSVRPIRHQYIQAWNSRDMEKKVFVKTNSGPTFYNQNISIL